MKDLTREAHSSVSFLVFESARFKLGSTYEDLHKSLKFLESLDAPLKITDHSEVVKVEDFLKKYLNVPQCEDCCFRCVLFFRNGQCQLYITKMELHCDNHASLFTKTSAISIPFMSTNVISEESSLKFLQGLFICGISREKLKDLGAIITNCNYLNKIDLDDNDDCVCDLLKQVLTPSTGSRKVGPVRLSIQGRITTEAVKLATLLPNFNVVSLVLDFDDCNAVEVNILVYSFAHSVKSLEVLELVGLIFTPAVVATLGQSLPEMSSLKQLCLTGRGDDILQDEHINALFGGFNKVLPLYTLDFSDFGVVGSLSSLIKSLCFFPKLGVLRLLVNVDECDLRGLLESFRFIPVLKKLTLDSPLGHTVTSLIRYIDDLPELELLYIGGVRCPEEDLSYVREALKQKRPGLNVYFNGR